MRFDNRIVHGGGLTNAYATGGRGRGGRRSDEADTRGNDHRKNDCTHS
jgi:hypothetical protein